MGTLLGKYQILVDSKCPFVLWTRDLHMLQKDRRIVFGQDSCLHLSSTDICSFFDVYRIQMCIYIWSSQTTKNARLSGKGGGGSICIYIYMYIYISKRCWGNWHWTLHQIDVFCWESCVSFRFQQKAIYWYPCWDFFVVVITYSEHISMVIIRQAKCKQNVRKHTRYTILIVLITMYTLLYG